MFKKLKKLDFVNTCFSSNQNIVIISERLKTIWLNNKVIFNGDGYLFAIIQANDFLVFGNPEKIFVGKIGENDFQLTDGIGISWNTYSKKGVAILKNKTLDSVLFAYKSDGYYRSFKNGKELLLFEQETGILLFTYDEDSKILFRNMNILKSFSLKTGNCEWELDFGKKINGFSRIEGNEISRIIGLSGEELLLSLSDFSLVSVNTNTGKIIWNFNREQMEEILNQSTFLTVQGFENGSIENHQLYILHGGCYIIFDLATQTAKTLWEASGIYEELSIVQTVFTYEYIYFTGAFGFPFNPNLLGVFNRQILNIDWLHEGTELPQVGGYRGSYRQIQVLGEKMYALDDSEVSSGTLHIFEKTEENE